MPAWRPVSRRQLVTALRRSLPRVRYGGAGFRTKVTKAIAGRFEESRIANCIISKHQPAAVHSFRIFSSDSALTSLVSTTL